MPPVPSRWSAPGRKQVGEYLDEIERLSLGTSLIGFTGGEPLINPEHTRLRRQSKHARLDPAKMSDYAFLALAEERP